MLELTEAQHQFVEHMGLHFESLGIARIGGRILGLMLLAERPLMLDEIAELLLVSRASVSTNTRAFLHLGLLAQHSIPGDRRRYYAFNPKAWDFRLGIMLSHAHELGRLTTEGIAAATGPVSRARLQGAQAFARFLEEQAQRVAGGWRERNET